ncbi:hypothetical protein E2562_006514 [Oryza meyeriana var. granulata]|uniref:Uncharacterized protein n=1 Tax=Oryza meyeriana var. granulata TaxID=110450 RepID=A0A6G1CP13_9ORYZ|nr:hypothetical protein E2562_006514 [Oryza meyeriana var. granulata]
MPPLEHATGKLHGCKDDNGGALHTLNSSGPRSWRPYGLALQRWSNFWRPDLAVVQLNPASMGPALATRPSFSDSEQQR